MRVLLREQLGSDQQLLSLEQLLLVQPVLQRLGFWVVFCFVFKWQLAKGQILL